MRCEFDKPGVRPETLIDQIIAALPILAPVLRPGQQYPEAVFRYWVDRDAGKVFIDIDDGIPVTCAQIKAVIDAHTGAPRPPIQLEQDFEQVKALLRGPGQLTAAQVKFILRVYGKQLAFLSREE